MILQNPTFDVDLGALCANYRRLRGAQPSAAAAAVVKCDAYGLGAAAVARALMKHEGCDAFFVAYAEEGAALRSAIGTAAEIFVFNGPFENQLAAAYRDSRLTPVINTLEQAALWAAEMPGAPAALHFDTGINRLGLAPQEAGALRAIAGLNASVVMSHLSCASEPPHEMNDRQRRRFQEIAALFPGARTSLAASAGALLDRAFGGDLLRLGVGLYGVNPLDSDASVVEPVATLTAPVIAVRRVAAGAAVGYGATFTTPAPSILATVLLGYGDGFPRAASNRGAALLGGALCRVVGRVSMDLIVLDATAATPSVGDRAEFFGRNLPIETAASACGTIGYELLTAIGGLARPRRGLGGRVERRYLFDGAPVDAGDASAEGN